jgi:beta-galactosidase
MNLVADFDSQTYPPPSWLTEYMAGTAVRKGEQGQTSHEAQHGPMPPVKPFFMNEYAHAMGNSVGNLRDYWQVIDGYPELCGGFIWEWCEHGVYPLAHKPERPRGITKEKFSSGFLYGGDFGDKPNSGILCIDGLVHGDRRPNPSLVEVGRVYQPVRLTWDRDKKNWVIENNHQVLSMALYTGTLTHLVDGKEVATATWSSTLRPGTKEVLIFPFQENDSGESMVRLDLAPKSSTDQGASAPMSFEIPLGIEASQRAEEDLKTALPAPNHYVKIHGPAKLDGSLSFDLDMKTGWLNSLCRNGQELLVRPCIPNFWRVPIDNDLGNNHPERVRFWKDAGSALCLVDMKVEGSAVAKKICTLHRSADGRLNITTAYSFHPSGPLVIESCLEAEDHLPEIPRIGWRMGLPPSYDQVEWYGRGPGETASDRKSGSRVGIYRNNVLGLQHDYVRPQENGNRVDTRWMHLQSHLGKGLIFSSPQLFTFAARPYSQEHLEVTSHHFMLTPMDFTEVLIDFAQMGVGGDNSWGARTHKEYCLPAGTYRYRFFLG